MWKIKLRLKGKKGKWTEVYYLKPEKAVGAIKNLLGLAGGREHLGENEIIGFSGMCPEVVSEENAKRYLRIAKKRRRKP
jgi:hypothetical protein